MVGEGCAGEAVPNGRHKKAIATFEWAIADSSPIQRLVPAIDTGRIHLRQAVCSQGKTLAEHAKQIAIFCDVHQHTCGRTANSILGHRTVT